MTTPLKRATLAIDLGTTCGWALKDGDLPIVSGTQSFKPGRYEGGGMRYLRFQRWLAEICAPHIGNIEIRFEEVRRHLGVDAAHVYGGLLSHLASWCDQCTVPYAGVPVATIKKFATGKGNASKEDMIEAMKARGFTPADDNEADALALLLLTLEGGN